MDSKEQDGGCCGGEASDAGRTATATEVREIVRRRYAATAEGRASCCETRGHYTQAELSEIPPNADLGLGSGNPVAAADVRPGERVLDLGSGAGVDVFLAARRVGPAGRVVGVDMVDEMIELARENAVQGGFENVEFRRGLIESPPVEPGTFDLIISNCVINLSPDKDSVFRAAFEALKPGGRLVVSDMVFDREPSVALRTNLQAYCVCVAGADLLEGYLGRMKRAGFVDAEVLSKSEGMAIEGEDARILRLVLRARRPRA